MAKAPVMPLWTDALIGDTTHLSAEQFGCYLLILIAMWRNNGKPLPDDAERMQKICKISRYKWKKNFPIIREFFFIDSDGWHQQRLEKEWNRVSLWIKKYEQNRVTRARGTRSRPHTHNPIKESESLPLGALPARACVPAGEAAHARDNERLHSIGDILGGINGGPAPAEPRSSTHWRYLLERGRSGEADAYFALIDAATQRPPDAVFEAVEARLVADEWDDRRAA